MHRAGHSAEEYFGSLDGNPESIVTLLMLHLTCAQPSELSRSEAPQLLEPEPLHALNTKVGVELRSIGYPAGIV